VANATTNIHTTGSKGWPDVTFESNVGAPFGCGKGSGYIM
jgi:hypothetical protein